MLPNLLLTFEGNPNILTIFFISKVKKKLKYQCGESSSHKIRVLIVINPPSKYFLRTFALAGSFVWNGLQISAWLFALIIQRGF